MIDDGLITGIYRGELLKGEAPYYNKLKFCSAVKLEKDKWNNIKLTYNYKKLCLTVNGKLAAEVPCSRRAWWRLSGFTFGGWGGDSNLYFDGLLKSFKVKHYVD